MYEIFFIFWCSFKVNLFFSFFSRLIADLLSKEEFCQNFFSFFLKKIELTILVFIIIAYANFFFINASPFC